MLKNITILFIIIFLSSPMLTFSHSSEFSEAPKEITIPSLGLNLPVTSAKIAYDTWEVSEYGASYGIGTALPGQKGNTVIFAHARENLFASLPDINKGEYVHVFTDKDWFVYRVYEIKIVEPQDVSVLLSQKKNELTLFTCFGTDYSKRYIVKANLVANSSAF